MQSRPRSFDLKTEVIVYQVPGSFWYIYIYTGLARAGGMGAPEPCIASDPAAIALVSALVLLRPAQIFA